MAVTTVTKSSLIDNISKNFYDRLKANVTTVTLVDTSVITIQTYARAYNDTLLTSNSNYPVLIVDSPKISTERFTSGKSQVDGTIDIEIYSTSSEASDKFLSSIINSIETFRDDLLPTGLKNIQIQSTDSDFANKGGFKVHLRRVVFSFKYYYTTTRSA